jgi:hypothetical protein
MLPDRVTAAAFAAELGPAREWAKREQFKLECDLPKMELRVTFSRADSGECFYLRGRFDGYKALPPTWEWCDANWSNAGEKRLSPDAAQTAHGSSVFLDHHGTAIICAPFNRLAYAAHGGPHSNWGELTHWMTVARRVVYAVTIGDMLHSIARDFRYTSGRMA